ncbi:ErfK/YbiS/YcfS/YnhG family protein [Candidatus Sulfobium mesophilum]|uniref:ErfK/YbiS/YcfS/YnhG family protein n=1 Tax=Candidatus Sulfobium mesophilum TaxID=2016548 RepID=A0A2U3QFZ7_9BACT|nr:ErfK/YbiS/YcfS/YnhG family protein [Candidatus Sulfobium mesophilum]
MLIIMNKIIPIIAFFFLICQAAEPAIEVCPHDSNDAVLGAVTSYKVKEKESLIEIARKFDLGYNAIAAANPDLDPFIPGDGASVTIPTSWILPDVVKVNGEGIVINLSELRLYFTYYVGKVRFIKTFPIGIGSEGNDTPTGQFKVIEKIVQPSWHVPESIKKEKPELPDVVPPGPDNPLGSHAMRLSLPSVLIHGTNKPWGVGRRVSHGCIRLYPEDIPILFRSVPQGVKVTIVKQPVKIGLKGDRVYIEVHKDETKNEASYRDDALLMLRNKKILNRVDTKKLHYAIEEKKGMPVDISDEAHFTGTVKLKDPGSN